MNAPIDQLPTIVQRLYALVAELEAAFPGRPFTPDGHLVGSLGEVLASHYYDLTLLPCSTACHDAQARDGRLVQVKATQGRTVALRAQPDHFLVIHPRGVIRQETKVGMLTVIASWIARDSVWKCLRKSCGTLPLVELLQNCI